MLEAKMAKSHATSEVVTIFNFNEGIPHAYFKVMGKERKKV